MPNRTSRFYWSHLRWLLAPSVLADTRTIKIIVPSTAGGGADTLARLLGDQISRKQSQTIIVENRPERQHHRHGVRGSRSPGGNTVLVTTPEFVINAHLRKLNYDPLTASSPSAIWSGRRS